MDLDLSEQLWPRVFEVRHGRLECLWFNHDFWFPKLVPLNLTLPLNIFWSGKAVFNKTNIHWIIEFLCNRTTALIFLLIWSFRKIHLVALGSSSPRCCWGTWTKAEHSNTLRGMDEISRVLGYDFRKTGHGVWHPRTREGIRLMRKAAVSAASLQKIFGTWDEIIRA